MLPLPLEAKVSSPGFALASAISSRTELAGTEGLITSRIVALPTSVTGTKSRAGLYGSFAEQAGRDGMGAAGSEQHGVAVGRRLGDGVRAESAAGAAPVLDDERLLQALRAADRR